MPQYYIGLMSGTSLDGVDAVLADISGNNNLHVEQAYSLPYPPALRAEVLALQPVGHNELDRAAILANQLATLYAQAITGLLAQARLAPADITAIGCHGQTIRHAPQAGYTLQIGNLALLAELTGIDVIGDFRSRDIAAQGQGAPLVPAFHQAVFASAQENRVIVNIGGISNITRLSPTLPVIGFDCGPGNMLMDAWIHQHQGHTYDKNGQWAASGQVIPALLQACLTDPYFQAPPPKSTGRELFDLPWLTSRLTAPQYKAEDIQRTLVELTAQSIVQAIEQYCPDTHTLYICGGGAFNPLLVDRLTALASHTVVHSTSALGLPPDQVEATAFAWLAYRFNQRLAGNLPDVTGASGPRLLGALYPR